MPRSLNQDFFKVWTPQMAYVLGYFAADGCMSRNIKRYTYIEFKSTDKCLIEIVQRIVNSSHSISEYERGGNCKTCYRIQICSKTWFNDLESLGFTQRKSRTLQFPKVPIECFGDFTRGYFDGDGCVYFNTLKFSGRRNERSVLMTLFTSGSRPFLEALLENFREYGITGGHILRKERGFDLRFSHRDSLALYRLMYNTAEVADLYLPRKRRKLEEAIQALRLE